MKEVFFFIGTEAELIKLFPVIIDCQKRGGICHIISSGQNDLKKSRILGYIQLNGQFVELSTEADIKKSAVGLLVWFAKTLRSARKTIRHYFGDEVLKGKMLVVHGDTISTFMGALTGRKLKMKVCHVEAGLRSHNLFNPFPEEIDRLLTSRLARLHFAPGQEAADNLKNAKGMIVNTEYNTILDSLNFSLKIPIITEKLDEILQKDYFVFVMHRQENLMNKDFFANVIMSIEEAAKKRKCVIILHKITENALRDMGQLSRLQENENFILLKRVDYFDFMKLLRQAEFIITDGGSNQEELYYMGKPCLIMRKTTERSEGIGENAKMFNGDLNEITLFADNYKKYERASVDIQKPPSCLIAETLLQKE